MNDTIVAIGNLQPSLGNGVFVAPGATVAGDVTLGDHASVWFGTVLRGDINRIVIGPSTNLQDLTIAHVADDQECRVGAFVTVGHRAILHGCRIGNEVLVGMGAILMNAVEVGDRCIIGAGALLTEGLKVPPGSLVYGAPAKVVSSLDLHEQATIRRWAEKYVGVAARYRAECRPARQT